MTDRYDAWAIFEVDEAQDCESVDKALRDARNARGYTFDGDSQKQLHEVIQALEERAVSCQYNPI